MGIPKYLSIITKNFLCYEKPTDIHTLCIDINYILHNICKRATNEATFKNHLNKELKTILRRFKPTHNIALFTDGQAVLAKAKTQIKRRNKYLYNIPQGLTRLHLTAGSPFMEFVDTTIFNFLQTITNLNTFYSPSSENNEGELKLFTWLNNSKINNNVVIFGQDSDLIVLGLKSNLPKLYINYDSKYISIKKLTECLAQYIPVKFGLLNHPVKKDFILLSMMLGNDYLPSVSDFKKLWTAYIKLQKNKINLLINKDNTLNLNNLNKLFKLIPYQKLPINSKKSTESDVKYYLKSLNWNYKLYSDDIYPNFMPINKRIDIESITKFMPHSIDLIYGEKGWLNPEVFLLLLLPSTGKYILPKKLQYFMEIESPIYDLFPLPCSECIIWKNKIKNLQPIEEDFTEEDKLRLKTITTEIHMNYNNHRFKYHPEKDLPIKRITHAISNYKNCTSNF